MRSLRARIIVVTVVVAIVAVAVTGLVSIGLIRSATTDEARDQLAAQASALVKLPNLDAAADRLDAVDTYLVLVRDGVVEGEGGRVRRCARARAPREKGTRCPPRAAVRWARRWWRPAPRRAARRWCWCGRSRASIARSGRRPCASCSHSESDLRSRWAAPSCSRRLLARQLTQTAEAAGRLAAGERDVPLPNATTTEVAAVTSALGALDTALATSEGGSASSCCRSRTTCEHR